MAANLEEQQCLRECTEYMQRSNIVPVMKDCFVQLCVDQPENPVTFLREYFQKLERVSRLFSFFLMHAHSSLSLNATKFKELSSVFVRGRFNIILSRPIRAYYWLISKGLFNFPFHCNACVCVLVNTVSYVK